MFLTAQRFDALLINREKKTRMVTLDQYKQRESFSNFTIADGGMTQQPIKISSMIVSYYPLNSSGMHSSDPLFHQLQKQ